MTIYYLCHENSQTPYGGVLVLYRHVDRLNAAGFPARVVHGVKGFRCTWFENDTPVVHPPLVLTDADLLVVPEHLNPVLCEIAPGVPKVSFNQNAYLTFRNLDDEDPHPYATCADLVGVLCVSDDNLAYLQHAFPDTRVLRVRNSFGGDAFRPHEGERTRRQLAYMPRKRPHDSHQVLSMLRRRGALDGWEVVPIAGLDREAVAGVLRESALFLAFGEHEGFGMPPVEALASGCHVIGYTGLGGDEYFDDRFTTRVPEGDVLRFAQLAEEWLTGYDARRELARGLAGADVIRDRYSEEAEVRSIVTAFESLLAAVPPPQGVSCVLPPDQTWLPGERPRPPWVSAAAGSVRRLRRRVRR